MCGEDELRRDGAALLRKRRCLTVSLRFVSMPAVLLMALLLSSALHRRRRVTRRATRIRSWPALLASAASGAFGGLAVHGAQPIDG